MKYNNHLNYKKRKRSLFRLKLAIAAVIILSVLGLGYYFRDLILDTEPNNANSVTAPTNTYFVPSINIFRTPYFQFQADDNWVEVPAASNDNKFTYSFVTNNLIEHELVVYVNRIPANVAATRVMPVTINEERTALEPGKLSPHCSKVAPPEKVAKVSKVTMSQIEFNCDNITPNFSILVGEPGESTVLELRRPDGTRASYTIFYQNLRAELDASQLNSILKSFQTR